MSEVSVAVEDKTQLLGDIPIVGKAFRTEIEEQFQNQLFFFIRAQVLDAAGVPVTKSAVIFGSSQKTTRYPS